MEKKWHVTDKQIMYLTWLLKEWCETADNDDFTVLKEQLRVVISRKGRVRSMSDVARAHENVKWVLESAERLGVTLVDFAKEPEPVIDHTRTRRRWTKKERRFARREYKKGTPVEVIAANIRRTTTGTYSMLMKMQREKSA